MYSNIQQQLTCITSSSTYQLANLLSVYELRNHLLGIESLCRTVVGLTVSSVLDGPGPLIREAGCSLAYSLSIVKVSLLHLYLRFDNTSGGSNVWFSVVSIYILIYFCLS